MKFLFYSSSQPLLQAIAIKTILFFRTIFFLYVNELYTRFLQPLWQTKAMNMKVKLPQLL